MEAAPNKRSYRRLAAMRALLRGWPRAEVAQVFGRSERMGEAVDFSLQFRRDRCPGEQAASGPAAQSEVGAGARSARAGAGRTGESRPASLDRSEASSTR